MSFVESTFLRSCRGAVSSSGLKVTIGLEWLPFSGGRSAVDGSGKVNGDAIVFTKLFTRSRFREGGSKCLEGRLQCCRKVS